MIKQLKNPWWVVFGSALALVVGNGPIMQFTFGVFLLPIVTEFQADRGTASLALAIGLATTAVCLPFVGSIADRVGSRVTALVAVCLFAAGIISLGLFANSLWTFMALFILIGAVATGQTPLPYMQAVTACFDKKRGLALGLTLTGVGIGTIIVPILVQYLVGLYGWRGGYIGMGILILVVALPAILLFVPNVKGARGKIDTSALPGLTAREALRTKSFWLMAVGLFLAAGATNGTIAHVVPMLIDRGVNPQLAATAMASVGISSMLGRVIAGYLLDRFWAPLVSMAFLFGIGVGMALLILFPDPSIAGAAVFLLGLGLGVEADLISFLLSRYLGLKAFGSIFGYVFGAFMLANSLGPILMGTVFQMTGSYTSCLILFMGFIVAAAVAFLALGPYVYSASRPDQLVADGAH